MQGLLEEADGPYDRALQLAEELFGAESVKVATSLNNKAQLLREIVSDMRVLRIGFVRACERANSQISSTAAGQARGGDAAVQAQPCDQGESSWPRSSRCRRVSQQRGVVVARSGGLLRLLLRVWVVLSVVLGLNNQTGC